MPRAPNRINIFEAQQCRKLRRTLMTFLRMYLFILRCSPTARFVFSTRLCNLVPVEVEDGYAH